MSFRLPPHDHKARELMGDVHTVAKTLNPAVAHKLPTTYAAVCQARRTFAADKTGAMKRIYSIVLRGASDERWLISIGPRGGWRKEWNFGNGKPV